MVNAKSNSFTDEGELAFLTSLALTRCVLACLLTAPAQAAAHIRIDSVDEHGHEPATSMDPKSRCFDQHALRRNRNGYPIDVELFDRDDGGS